MRQALGVRLFFVAIDVICLLASFTLVYYLRQHVFLDVLGGPDRPTFTPYLQIFIAISVLWVIASLQVGLFNIREMTFEEEVIRIFFALMLILIFLILILTLMKVSYNYSRFVIFGGIIVSFFTIILMRTFMRRQLDKIEVSKRNVLLICGSPDMPDMVQRHLALFRSSHNLTGVVLPQRCVVEGETVTIGDLSLRVLEISTIWTAWCTSTTFSR